MGYKDDPGGIKAHGVINGGLSAILAQLGSLGIRSTMWQNKGPGKMYAGTSAVTISNTVEIAVGAILVLDSSSDDTWIVWDQAASSAVFIREMKP